MKWSPVLIKQKTIIQLLHFNYLVVLNWVLVHSSTSLGHISVSRLVRAALVAFKINSVCPSAINAIGMKFKEILEEGKFGHRMTPGSCVTATSQRPSFCHM